MINFREGYRDTVAKGIGLSGVPKEEIRVDPTKIFPSTESPTNSNQHGARGNFYRFNVSPTSFDLDPYFFFRDNDYGITLRSGNATDMNHTKDPLASGTSRSVQAMVTKGPIYLSGWGYDICGLPMPHSNVPTSGRYFDPRTSVNRAIWKTGPVDLRWDDDRKVWTGGTEVIEGKMFTALPGGNFEAPTIGTGIIYRGKALKYSTFRLATNEDATQKPDPYGVPISKDQTLVDLPEYVRLTNRNSQMALAAGDYFVAVKVNYEWRVISKGNGLCIVGKYKKLNCSSPSVTKTEIPDFTLNKLTLSDGGTSGGMITQYQLRFTDLGQRRVYVFKTEEQLLPDLIPSDSAGARLVPSDGIIDITTNQSIGVLQMDGSIKPSSVTVPYNGLIAMIAFQDCQMSSNVMTYGLPSSGGYLNGSGTPKLLHQKVLNRLFDCPDSTDNFGIVTDDQGGAEYYAMHPFKYVKHGVRVIACPSDLQVVCNNEFKGAYAITEVDDCSNAGTPLARE